MITGRHDGNGTTPTCCLHIGMPKTATKTLQFQIFENHPQVHYLGKYYRELQKHPRFCFDEDTADLTDELFHRYPNQLDSAKCRKLFDRVVAPALAKGLTPVWSWESMLENFHEVQRYRAENFKEIFGDCKVIVTIRHPLDLIESLYLQLLKRDNVGTHSKRGTPPTFSTIDDWLVNNWDKEGDPPKVHLEYDQGIETYSQIFGRENVGVFLFEELATDPESYFSSICRFIGIDEREGVNLARDEKRNARWTDTQIEKLKKITNSWIRSRIFQYSSRSFRVRMLGLPAGTGGIPAKGSRGYKPQISADLQVRVLDKTRQGNRFLAEKWNLPLEKYGYPL